METDTVMVDTPRPTRRRVDPADTDTADTVANTLTDTSLKWDTDPDTVATAMDPDTAATAMVLDMVMDMVTIRGP